MFDEAGNRIYRLDENGNPIKPGRKKSVFQIK